MLDPLNAQISTIDAITGLVGQQKEPIVNIRNFGQNSITSFDVTIDYNGSQVTENVTSLNLTSLQTYQVNFSNQITLATGTLPVTAYIYNINGGLIQNTADDTLSISVTGTYAAPGKIVVEKKEQELGVLGPRGAVAMNWMDENTMDIGKE